jgi:hypothetical protein
MPRCCLHPQLQSSPFPPSNSLSNWARFHKICPQVPLNILCALNTKSIIVKHFYLTMQTQFEESSLNSGVLARGRSSTGARVAERFRVLHLICPCPQTVVSSTIFCSSGFVICVMRWKNFPHYDQSSKERAHTASKPPSYAPPSTAPAYSWFTSPLV